ncbi:zinc finger protein 345-like [Archocentrus centrarchus]|uniref:zinc finger protein 345-like n=1 Tax=Archocentrus centrarchus TaxID=63155 RepID=UPI0011E9C9E3|nr:zinc finger protein 345-like [Archocentrus centrarchus]
MSVTAPPPRCCGLRTLADSVSELLARVAEEVLGALEKWNGGSRSSGAPGSLLQVLRPLLTERLAAAAQRIVGLLEREVEESRRRLRRLEALLCPVVLLNRTDTSALCQDAADESLHPLSDSAHMPSVPPHPASSDIVSAAESDDHWTGSKNSLSIKRTDRRTVRRRSSGWRQWKASLDCPTNQRCLICGKIFCHRGTLVKHVETHSDTPEHLCGVCGEHFESSDSLSDHLRSHRETLSGSGRGRTCEVCGKMFQNMETHMRSHTGVKPFSCSICRKSFPRPGALRRHKKIHSRRMGNACPICGVTFAQSQLLHEHLKIHEHGEGDYSKKEGGSEDTQSDSLKPREEGPTSGLKSAAHCCRVCGDSFHSRGFLRKHAEMHCRESQSMCGVCGQQLDSPDVLRTHLQSHRETGGICSVCGKTFQNMETHMRSHTGLKPYRCFVCGKHFPRPGALRRHKKIHSGERPHVCNHCGKTFVESTALKTHRRSHSLEVCDGEVGKSPADSQILTSDAEKARMPAQMPPCCKVCGESFQSKGSLRKHAKSHSAESICGVCGESLHPSETLTEHLQSHRDAGKICHICGKTYQNIETHMRSHTGVKPYHCTICRKSFPRPGALRRHKRIHSGERPYICEFCGKTFIDNGALTTHIRNHTGNKPSNRVSCETCGKSLASIHVLEVHKRIHTGEKPFQCRICRKAFRQVGGLNAHMLTHTGEKPFSCSLCGKSFSTKGYLETHLRFHRKERAFSCHLCWKAFVTKNDLKKHLLTHSGEKPYSCRLCDKSYQEKRSRDLHMKIHMDTSEDPIREQDSLQPHLLQL